MSNPLIASNQNSALVATILESKDAISNPFLYSESGISPPHSVQIINVQPSTGATTATASKTMDFDLPKVGLLRRMTFTAKVNRPAGANGVASSLAKSGHLFVIESAELLSSGRRISLLTKEMILAKMADKPEYVRRAYEQAVHAPGGDVAAGANAAQALTLMLPLDFFFSNSNKYALNTSFIEPLRLRITYGNFSHGGEGARKDYGFVAAAGENAEVPGVKISVSDPQLLCEYRDLPNNYSDETIEENFGSGMLTQLIENYTYESPSYSTIQNLPADRKVKIDLLETGGVKAMYIVAYVHHDQADDNDERILCNAPLEIEHVTFKAGGQTIIDCAAEYLRYFGNQEDTVDKYAVCGTKAHAEDCSTQHAVKVDFGFDRNNLSNVISFRELHAPQLEVTLKEIATFDNARQVTIQVCHSVAQLMTTQSSTGKINISLSN
jgi:hypothetical protein